MHIGLGLGITSLAVRQRSSVSIASLLFANNEPGFWFDYSDTSTLFQDTAGTQPVTTPGQTVALVLDKSGRGNHATQPTAASRPTYGIVPKTGRRNLLTRTEEFDNAAWVKRGVTPTQVSGEVWELNEGSDSGESIIYNALDAVNSTLAASTAIDVKAGNSSPWVRLSIRNIFSSPAVDINLDTLEVIPISQGLTDPEFLATPLEDGWYRLSITHSGATDSALNRQLALCILSPSRDLSYTGTNRSILIRRPQREFGSTATAYQRVTSQYDVTEAGVPSLGYLQADGVDDWMVTPTITPGTDKVFVGAGLRKLSDATRGTVVEMSTSIASNNGAIHLTAPDAASATLAAESKGTTLTAAIDTGIAAPASRVVVALGDIAGDRSTLRINGVQEAQNTGDQGTGNYLAYPAYLFRRGGTTLPFNGQAFQMISRFGPNLDTATIEKVEAIITAKTPENV